MAVAYILAHFDDEYGAYPLIRDTHRRGAAQHFFYLADYADPAGSERRSEESRAYLRSLGLPADCLEHVGRNTGALDGDIRHAVDRLYPRLLARLREMGPIEAIVTPAWEGGHADHDVCAALAVALGQVVGADEVRQFSLYNGAGLTWRFFRAGSPLAENGPVERLALSARELLAWALDVRRFPSQARTWMGLWPAMFLTVAMRGWGVQRLDATRLAERPHAGKLYYERVFGVPYAEVRRAVDDLLSRAPGPA